MNELKKKDLLSVGKRNAIVVNYLWCIDSAIRQNYGLKLVILT